MSLRNLADSGSIERHPVPIRRGLWVWSFHTLRRQSLTAISEMNRGSRSERQFPENRGAAALPLFYFQVYSFKFLLMVRAWKWS